MAVMARMVNPVVPRLAASGRRDGGLFCVFGLTIGAVQKRTRKKKPPSSRLLGHSEVVVAGKAWRLRWDPFQAVQHRPDWLIRLGRRAISAEYPFTRKKNAFGRSLAVKPPSAAGVALGFALWWEPACVMNGHAI